jgi:lipopolysaccharide transport system permease protein
MRIFNGMGTQATYPEPQPGFPVGQPRATTPMVVVQPSEGLFHLDLLPVWKYRELLYFLVWRDIKVRYKQTAIGAAWAICQPLLTMMIFAVIFGRFAKIPSDNVPYPIFAFAGLLPWTYFSQSIARSGMSLVSDANLIRKIYFPRLIIPAAAVVAPLVDFILSFLILLVMMAWYRVTPGWAMATLPLFMCLAVAAACGVSLWLSALNVRYRDVGHAIPFLVQFWMYASPIVYPVTLIPGRWRTVYSLNPIVGVVEGFRWGLLSKPNPDFRAIAIGCVVTVVVFLSGLVFFKRMERVFADIV